MDFDFGVSAFMFLTLGSVFVFIFAMIGRTALQMKRQKALDDAAPVLMLLARVVAKRTQVGGGSGHSSAYSIYYATFEFASGERREFRMKGEEYGLLAENDQGDLTHQGTRYQGFARKRR